MGLELTRRRLCATALAAASLMLAGPAFAQTTSPTEVTIALSSSSLAYGGLRIAEQIGLFQKHGFAPKIVVMDSGSAATAALIAGSAQFASSGPAEVLAARAKGLDVRIVTNVYSGFAAPVVLSNAAIGRLSVKRDASADERFKALDGLKIAVPSATSALLAPVRGSAEKAGATPSFIYMAQPTMAAALQAGAIDGFVASSPFWGATVLAKSGEVWLDTPHGELPDEFQPASSAVMQAMGSFAEQNPDAVKRMKAVFVELTQFIKDEPGNAADALVAAYPKVDPETIRLAFESDAENWSDPDLNADDMTQEISLLSRAITLPGLKELDPSAVVLDLGE